MRAYYRKTLHLGLKMLSLAGDIVSPSYENCNPT